MIVATIWGGREWKVTVMFDFFKKKILILDIFFPLTNNYEISACESLFLIKFSIWVQLHYFRRPDLLIRSVGDDKLFLLMC